MSDYEDRAGREMSDERERERKTCFSQNESSVPERGIDGLQLQGSSRVVDPVSNADQMKQEIGFLAPSIISRSLSSRSRLSVPFLSGSLIRSEISPSPSLSFLSRSHPATRHHLSRPPRLRPSPSRSVMRGKQLEFISS
ncbi:unnamed protein product [Pleuronectes platessa]|uniref:Uncharacterized protein n=1 Tax=Pleuronectes platessa TaxID=8262 RepID=A0A9N7TVN1_PLEPL|nr:unnamed protein product [Pleuronectes platessa]